MALFPRNESRSRSSRGLLLIATSTYFAAVPPRARRKDIPTSVPSSHHSSPLPDRPYFAKPRSRDSGSLQGANMAAFRQHVTFSTVLGLGYAAALKGLGWDAGQAMLAGGLC